MFAKNSLMKNIFKEEKTFDSGTRFFSENSSHLRVFWPRRVKLTTELSEKLRYSRNEAIKKSLNEAILLLSINETWLSR